MDRRAFLKSLIAAAAAGLGATNAASVAFAQQTEHSARHQAEALPETIPAQTAEAGRNLDEAAQQGEWSHWYYRRRRRWRRRRVVYYYYRPRRRYWRRRYWRRRYYYRHW